MLWRKGVTTRYSQYLIGELWLISNILIGCWRFLANEKLVGKATIEIKTGATMWKSIKSLISNRCQKRPCFLFGVTQTSKHNSGMAISGNKFTAAVIGTGVSKLHLIYAWMCWLLPALSLSAQKEVRKFTLVSTKATSTASTC